jgi:colicin import membrane protein
MAQAEKRENSVLFSLRELRQIEENRVQEEERAVKSAEEAKRFAAEEAERRRREAEEQRIREEREAHLQIEQAREGAEREARMRVESAEAAERARQQGALEAQRLQQEMELRRAEVARKRPTWMLAVTIAASIAVIAAIPLAIWAMGDRDSANASKEQTEKEAQAKVEAAELEKKKYAKQVEELRDQVAELDRKAGAAIEAADKAKSVEEQKEAIRRLKKLQEEKAQIESQIAAAAAAREKQIRNQGASVSKACLDNPLAKGCM